MGKVTYKKSGVDIDRANDFVRQIKPMAEMTRRPGVVGSVGGFGGFFKIPAAKYKNPLLVASADGVGTKVRCAKQCGRYEMAGVDLVAMSVNDILTCGAEPLFFLDYIAVGKLEPESMKEVVRGIAKACAESGCALLGGETAEMPGHYRAGDFDLAGFAVGAVEEGSVIDGSKVRIGDAIIGCASSGLHSNGFSMVREVLPAAFIRKHAEEILRPTRLYVKPVLDLMQRVEVKAMAHITGGGFYDNIPRVLPEGMGALIHAESWKIPRVFHWIKEKAATNFREMYRTFNMGIGYAIVVRPKDAVKTLSVLSKQDIEAWVIGEVVKEEGVRIQ